MWPVVGYGLRWAITEVGNMFRWFETDGYGVDIGALRERDPEMQDLETWLRQSSKFECAKKAAQTKAR
ncbi:hypothetical protein GGR56DRAFT_633535 [Xylariaceae sp. FL0804]|nr:hypothetical protein GGR56DRAFT_633535 [Xylariaceae sp. FL0804]